MLYRAFKWGLLIAVAYVLLVVARPAYWEAWKARQVAEQVSMQTDGMTRTEVRDRYLDALATAGIKRINKEDIAVERDGKKWIIGARYEVQRPIHGWVTLSIDFDIAANRKLLWANDQPSH